MADREIHACPVCEGRLHIREYHCSKCATTIRGDFPFRGGNLAGLAKHEQEFIEQFVRCRGSIKEMEKVLGVSYPTVRSKLDFIIERLGYSKPEHMKYKEEREEILKKLEHGEITAGEAAALLRGEGYGREDEDS